LGILLIYITPSGYGLKIVFKADVAKGNLIDNQHAMARVLGVEVDESCKDASRMSFICKESDILYLDDELFTYENKAFGEKYDEVYRQGNSQPTQKTHPQPLPVKEGSIYPHNVKYQDGRITINNENQEDIFGNEPVNDYFQSEDIYKDMINPKDCLRIKNCVKKFGDGKVAVNRVNLNLYKNEIWT